jgi:hypothetical protein
MKKVCRAPHQLDFGNNFDTNSQISLHCHNGHSIKVFPLVELDERLQTYLPLSLGVAVVYHVLYVLLRQLLPQLLSRTQQVLLRYVTLPVLVEVLKNTLYIFVSVRLAGSLDHEFYKFLESDLTSVVRVEDGHGDVDEGSARFVPSEVPNGLAQVHGGEHAVVIVIEEIEHLLEDLYFVDRAFCDHELFGVKGDIAFASETGFHSPLFRSLCLVLAFPVAASSATERLSPQHIPNKKYTLSTNNKPVSLLTAKLQFVLSASVDQPQSC